MINARFRPRTINKLPEGDFDARGSGRIHKYGSLEGRTKQFGL